MMKISSIIKKFGITGIFLTLLTGCVIAIGFHNYKTNSNFWSASAVNCVTIIVAIFISYWLTQKGNDKRKQKEILANLVFNIRLKIDQEDMYKLGDKSTQDINMRNRDITNMIDVLEGVKSRFRIETEVAFVAEKFDEYKELIGKHIDDRDYLEKSQDELKRPVLLMSNKLFEIALSLYN